jgi:nucleoside-diphosphate-sugar epimerase
LDFKEKICKIVKFWLWELYLKVMQRVLVTGGAGFIGSNLNPLLLEAGNSVVIFDNLSTGKLENISKIQGNPYFKFVKGDIRDRESLSRALQNVDAVVHLAALIDVSASVIDPISTNEINVEGTLNVLQEARNAGIKRLVFASSTAVYGDAKGLPIKEDSVLTPISPYAASKAAGEAYCSAFSNCYDLETVSLRFFNVYGPRNENSPYSGVITKFLRKAINNEPLMIEGDGQQTRDFIHVSEIAKALMAAIGGNGLGGEVFNICTGSPKSENQLVETLKRVLGKNLQVVHNPPRIGDIRNSYGDFRKAAKKLDFIASVTLETGLKMMLNELQN